MLIIPPPKNYRPRRRPAKKRVRVVSPTPVLVKVWYETALNVTMEFDRDVDVTNFDSTTVRINDADYGDLFEGKPFIGVLAPNRIQVSIQQLGMATGSGVRLTVPEGNGLVAASDGAAWAGVTDVVIPFGN